MAMNRVQFQPGLSMAEFMERYGSEAQCEQAVCESRWPKGYACPRCAARENSSFRRQGDWVRYLVMRGWQSSDGEYEGADKHSVEIQGRAPAGLRRMAPVEFDGLRVESYLNDDKTRSSLSLVASQVRSAAMRPAGPAVKLVKAVVEPAGVSS